MPSACASVPAALLAVWALSCGGRTTAETPSPLVVTSYAPAERSVGDEPIQLSFDQPVVDDEQVASPLSIPPVVLEPSLELNAHWLDRQTLVLEPRTPLRSSTRYKVSLAGELAERTGGFEFSFIHEPLVVEGIWGADLEQLPTNAPLSIHFNQPVRADAVAKHCAIMPSGADEAIALVPDHAGSRSADSAAGSDPADRTEKPAQAEKIAVRTASQLTPDTDYELVCDGITGAEGDVPLASPYVLPMHTHDRLAVVVTAPSGQDVSADDVAIEIEFTTPVDLETVRKSLRARPRISGLDQGWLDSSGTTYKVVANLESMTSYKITVSKTLGDTFGQTLGKPFQMAFRTGTARPRLSMETGIYAVETSSAGYPVWTRNVADFDIECAAIPRSKVVKLLTSSMDYDPWYSAGSNQAMKWKSLGVKNRKKRVAISEAKDKWHLSNLALHEVCGGRSQGKRGIFLADIASRHVKPDPDRMWRYRPHRRVLANVTDLGILLKAGTGSGLIWVTSISTGQPVAGADVTVYTPQGRRAYRGTTDSKGVLRLPSTTKLTRAPGADDKDEFDSGDDYYSYRSQRLIAIVEKAGDMAVVDGNWANGIQTWNFGVTEERRTGATRIRGFIQSDRGIYRPGETVYFKGLVREIAVGRAPVVPRSAKVEVNIEDSRGQTVYNKRRRLSEFGGFSFELPLEKESNLGDYYVTASIKGQRFREKFSVEEFRKVSFEVDVTGSERHGRLGDKLKFQVDADYLFGAPVVGSDVQWTVSRRSHRLHFPKYAQYGFSDHAARGWEYWYHDHHSDERYPSFVTDGSGKTDRRGKFRFSVRDPARKLEGPQDYIVGVSVRDETAQSVSRRVVVTGHQSDFYIGLHAQEYVQAVGMPFSVNVLAVDPGGERVATGATLKFIRQSHHCEYRGGYRSYSSCKTRNDVALERAIDIPATGTGTERIYPEKPGEYIVRIEARDSRGNKVVSSGHIWVLGKGEAFWSGDESARIGLIASKSEYKSGDTARLVPRTGLKNATALVTLERNGIIEAFIKPLESSSDGIEIPINADHAPNVFASVALVTGRSGEGDRHRPRFKMGITELKVSSDAKRLRVSVTPDKPSYEPGEEVSGVVSVTSGGQPVRAEVSLSVADEGVLQLIAYKTPDPMKSFYASWGLGVDNSTNWNRIARLADPTAGDPDMGGDSGGGEDDSVRSNFVSSAFWAPSLITDASGQVRFRFKAPDNLTAFRMMAVAADTGSRFGSGDTRFTVKKPLLAKPVLPRFLNSGDQATIGVIVHNYTDNAGTATVTTKTKGVRIGHKAGKAIRQRSRQVRLAKSGSKRVNFPIRVGEQLGATFEFEVTMNGYRDALRLEVPIHRPLLIDKKTVAKGVAGSDGEATIDVPVTWDDSLVANHSMVTITVDRTGLSELEPSLRYLIKYPYGCLEQTLSRFIPLTKAQDLARSLKLDELEGPKMKTFIRAGVAKVAKHQHSNGHFSLWPSGATYPHLTVYAIYGLTEARRAGVRVPDRTMERGVRAIKRWASKTTVQPGGEAGTLAMAAYVLAELDQADSGLNTRLYEARAGLPQYGKAFLLRAMHRADGSKSDVNTLQSDLLATATMSTYAGNELAMIGESRDLSRWMSSDVRSSAIAMSALLEVDPKNTIIEKLADGLKRKQSPGGGWRNTQENLYALVALSDYARKQSAGSAMVTVSINGKKELRRRLKGSKVLNLRRRLHNYEPGSVKIETSGKVRYAVRLTEAREDRGETPVDRGFSVRRMYLDAETGQPVTEARIGQLIKVQLTVQSDKNRRYVAVEDPLPAGFEAVNTRLATEAAARSTRTRRTRQSWRWTHRELRDDRALGFMDSMPRGVTTWEYLVRATTDGTFVVPPSRAEEMYSPEVNGRGTASAITIRK